MNNKFKNYGLWVSIFSLIGIIMGNYGLYSMVGLTQDSFKQIVDGVLGILVLAGVISNPSVGTGYSDKE